MTQIWYLAEGDESIPEVLNSWIPFTHKTFKQACFSGVGYCFEDYKVAPKRRLINAFPIVPSGKVFIESFNNAFRNIHINLLHEGPPFKMLEEFPYYGGNTTQVDIIPITLDITFSERYDRSIQWYIMIPFLQMVRGFGPRYSFYNMYAEHPKFEEVIDTSSSLSPEMTGSSPYGLWSSVGIDVKSLLLLDNPDIANEILKPHVKSYYLPYGSTICNALKRYIATQKGEVFEEEEEKFEDYDDEDDDDPYDN